MMKQYVKKNKAYQWIAVFYCTAVRPGFRQYGLVLSGDKKRTFMRDKAVARLCLRCIFPSPSLTFYPCSGIVQITYF
jgi:hypothetical protein